MVLNVSVHADFPIILALSGYMHNIITRNFMFVTLSAVDNNSTESLHSLKMYMIHSTCLSFFKKQFTDIDTERIVLLYFEVFFVVPSILKKCLGIYYNLILLVAHLIVFYVQNFQILK